MKDHEGEVNLPDDAVPDYSKSIEAQKEVDEKRKAESLKKLKEVFGENK